MVSTLFDRLWNRKVIKSLSGGVDLLHVDRHFIHDLEAGPRLASMEKRSFAVRRPDLTFATPDHAIATSPGRSGLTGSAGVMLLQDMRTRTRAAGITMFDLDTARQGIVHVIGPELGLSLPGLMIVCGDSHTCTHGGLGALAFGIGSSEVEHVLATQTLRQKRPKSFRIRFEGVRHDGVSAKDLILFTIGRLGTGAGRGYAVEYAGAVVRTLSVEERLTLCNLSIELGAKIGVIAPDDTVYDYITGRPFAPKGLVLEQAIADWRTLPSHPDAHFDREVTIDVGEVAPQITWGTSPQDVVPIDGYVPHPQAEADLVRRQAMEAALQYMGLVPGQRLLGTRVDWVFIGSCTNGRLSDLRAAANVVRGRSVAPGVKAWVVPGSEAVKRAAEEEGIHRVFVSAGFEWREPGCSLCLAANGEVIGPLERSVSTTNRNFVGRQGPGVRTHIAGPVVAAYCALQGVIADPRSKALP